MQQKDILDLLKRKPFQPFRVCLAGGTTHEIHHPQLSMVGRSLLVIGYAAPGEVDPVYHDYTVPVDLRDITRCEPLAPVTLPPAPEATA